MNVSQRMRDYANSASTYDRDEEGMLEYKPCAFCAGKADYCPVCDGQITLAEAKHGGPINDKPKRATLKFSVKKSRFEEPEGKKHYEQICSAAIRCEWYTCVEVNLMVEKRHPSRKGLICARVKLLPQGSYACEIWVPKIDGRYEENKQLMVTSSLEEGISKCESELNWHIAKLYQYKRSKMEVQPGEWHLLGSCVDRRSETSEKHVSARLRLLDSGGYQCMIFPTDGDHIAQGSVRTIADGIQLCEAALLEAM
jgi:hypothetical protein